jgi:uncharacterized membrane protein YbhN (UPF0104 family)
VSGVTSGNGTRGEPAATDSAFTLAGITRSRKRTVLVVLGAAALGVAVSLLIAKFAEFDDIANALHQADWRWLPLCLAGEIVSYGGYILAYRDFARVGGGPQLSTALAGKVVVVGIGATALGSTPGGLAVDYWAMHRAGATRRDAARRVLGLNTVKWLALALAASVAAVAALAGAGTAPPAMSIAWLVSVVVALALAEALSGGKRGERLAAPPVAPDGPVSDARSAGHWSLFAVREAFSDAIGGLLYVRRLYARPRAHLAGVAGFPLYWLGDIVCFTVALRAFGVELDAATIVLAYATGYVATGLPLPVGGSGGVEAAMTFALDATGVPLAQALLGVICYRLFAFWLPLIPALVAIPRLRRIEAQLAAMAAAGEEHPAVSEPRAPA